MNLPVVGRPRWQTGPVSLPLSTTTVTIKRPPTADDGKDPYDVPSAALSTVASGIRALFAAPSGGSSVGGGEHGATSSQEAVGWTLLADPCDLRHYDTVIDETTTKTYGVAWAKSRVDPDAGLNHVVAGVTEIEGAAA